MAEPDSARILILEWSAPPEAYVDDRDAWRLASPHWTPARLEALEHATRRAPSPIGAGSTSTNGSWRRAPGSRRRNGPTATELALELPRVAGRHGRDQRRGRPSGRPAATSSPSLDGERVLVSGRAFPSRRALWAALEQLARERRGAELLYPASFEQHVARLPGFPPVKVGTAEQRAGYGPDARRRLDGRLRHDGDDELTRQMLTATPVTIPDVGTTLSARRSPGPIYLARAAVWAIGAELRPEQRPRAHGRRLATLFNEGWCERPCSARSNRLRWELSSVSVRAPLAGDAGGACPASPSARGSPWLRCGTALEVAELAWIAEGISRETALSIPSVAACRNLIVGTVAQLGVFRYRGGERLDPDYLLSKPDPSTTWPATIGGTVDDLIFRGRAYWRVLERDSEGFTRRARWTPVDGRRSRTRARPAAPTRSSRATRSPASPEHVPPEDVIRFDSPIPARARRRRPDARRPRSSWRRPLAGSPRSSSPPACSRTRAPSSSDEEARDLVAKFPAARRDERDRLPAGNQILARGDSRPPTSS